MLWCDKCIKTFFRLGFLTTPWHLHHITVYGFWYSFWFILLFKFRCFLSVLVYVLLMGHTHRLTDFEVSSHQVREGLELSYCQIVKCIRAIWKILWTIYAHFSTSPCFCRVCLREVPTIHSTLVSKKWLQGSLEKEGKHASTWEATNCNIYMKSEHMLYYIPSDSFIHIFLA